MSTIESKFLYKLMEHISTQDDGKCMFKLKSGLQHLGWIGEIHEHTFEYFDSGPMARDEAYIIEIKNIDIDSFSCWDTEKWIDFKL